MGYLQDGVWRDGAPPTGRDGSFERRASAIRDWITPDGSPGPGGARGYPAESGRYHLYVSLACPWAHRALIFRVLKGLTEHISVDVVHPLLGDDGWTFDTDFPRATGDRIGGRRLLRDVYTDHDSGITSSVTVPVLWDKSSGRIVSNESADIIRMLNDGFGRLAGPTPDLSPAPLREEIDALNARVYDGLNNGVYRAGFARSQSAYDAAAAGVFDTLDWLEARLATRRWLVGEHPTEADWRTATTLFRFDLVYHGHFKCNRHRLVDYPGLWDYARALFQWPGVAETIDFDQIAYHYYASHRGINPTGVVPIGPAADWLAPHGRG